MEDTLRVMEVLAGNLTVWGLNPCSNGRYSQSSCDLCKEGYSNVLILVLMEDTLRVMEVLAGNLTVWGLNPCFNGRYSQSTALSYDCCNG